MRENDIEGVLKRVRRTFEDKSYLERLNTSDKKWIDMDASKVTAKILEFLEECK